ncbi:MAG TPA: hypothetical protein VHY22_08635, partial [Chthoniobacteraceae bacterium]|nr:hypothetical protein [Chthoniobacteraceae bacterium]
MTNRFCTLAFSLLALSSIACGNGVTALSTHGRNIYRLALAHLRPDAGAVQIVGTTYEGRLCAFQLQDGRLRSLWDAPLDSFAFAVTAFNPGGGAPEDDVAVGTSGGKVMAFDAAGRALWSFDFVTPVYSVAAVREPDGVFVAAGTVDGRLVLLGSDGKVRKEINFDGAIRCLLAGRFEGDGRQELFVTDWPRDSTMYAQVLDVPDLTPASPMWEKPLLMQSTSMADHGINAVVGDPWRRGRDAVISQRYVWLPDVSTAPVLKFGELGPKLYYAGDYRMSSPALGRFKSGGGVDQIAMVRGEELGLFHLPARPPPAPAMRQPAQDQQTGKIKKHKDGKAEAAEGNDGEEGADVLHAGAQAESNHSFTDILTIPGAGTDQLLLGSAPNGDDNLYLVTPDGADSWKAAIPRMPWQGCIARVNANIEQLGRELNTWHGAPAGGQPGPYVVVPEFRPKFGHSMPEGEGLARMIETNRYYCQRFPYPERIRFTQEFEVSEPAMADSEGMPAAQIIDLVKRLEAAGVPWIARIGHGGAMFVSPRTADAMLAAAPKTAVGFSIAEQSGGGKQTVPFFAGKVMPLVAVAHAHHVNFYLNEKGSFWASAGADPDFQKVLFDPKYYGTVVPGDEDSNSRSPDLNMLARAGLWLSGRTESWACRLIA